uniref:Uncharacterized protein n=1 Tax=Arundo donax TaxID=35708 RepID=A0A0A9EHT3_ARUDO
MSGPTRRRRPWRDRNPRLASVSLSLVLPVPAIQGGACDFFPLPFLFWPLFLHCSCVSHVLNGRARACVVCGVVCLRRWE